MVVLAAGVPGQAGIAGPQLAQGEPAQPAELSVQEASILIPSGTAAQPVSGIELAIAVQTSPTTQPTVRTISGGPCTLPTTAARVHVKTA